MVNLFTSTGIGVVLLYNMVRYISMYMWILLEYKDTHELLWWSVCVIVKTKDGSFVLHFLAVGCEVGEVGADIKYTSILIDARLGGE